MSLFVDDAFAVMRLVEPSASGPIVRSIDPGARATPRQQEGQGVENTKSLTSMVAGQEVRFSLVHGEVVGVDRLTDVQLDTTAGSVAVLGNFVSVTAPTITASTRASKKVWVRTDDGNELPIAAPDAAEARAGQRVVLVLASGHQGDEEQHRWCAIVNLTTRRWVQADRFPPVHVYNRWTNFWMVNAKQGGPVLIMFFILVLWLAIWLARLFLFGTDDGVAFFTNLLAAGAVGVGSLWWGTGQSKDAEETYARCVKRAAETAFQVEHPAQAPAATGAASG